MKKLFVACLLMIAVTAVAEEKVRLTYFHGDFRCATCVKLEEMSVAVARDSFQGREDFEFRTINFMDPDYEHYAGKYGLENQTLVLKRGGEWVKLEKMWELVEDPKGFADYVVEAVRDSLRRD